MAKQNFTATWINNLPYTLKRKVYIDASPNTKFLNCDFILVVGSKSKSAFLRYRPKINGVEKTRTIKIGDADVIDLMELREAYEREVLNLKKQDSPILQSKEIRKFNLGNAIDFYLAFMLQRKKTPADKDSLIKLKTEPFRYGIVGDLLLLELEDLDVQEIIQPLIDKGSLYSANMKREFIQRVWNKSATKHKLVRKILRGIPNPATFDMEEEYGFVKQASKKYLGLENIPEFFDIVATAHRSDLRDFFHLSLYLGQHPFGEIAKMRWDQLQEIDGQIWWIMETGFHKVKKSHQVPLHATVMEIINKYKGSDDVYVFPNTISNTRELYDQQDFKYIMKQFRAKHQIKWDMRCLRSTFITIIANADPTFKPQYLANQYDSTVTNKNYLHRGLISYHDLKIDMINKYMEIIQDTLNARAKES